jgi:hypothetical protein
MEARSKSNFIKKIQINLSQLMMTAQVFLIKNMKMCSNLSIKLTKVEQIQNQA